MAQSAHRYVRGSTLSFYKWLSDIKPGAIRDGPAIWICGDCHVGNLGPVANPSGAIEIKIRELDQTVIGNPAHDLLRLALSLASAARGSNLPGVTTALMLEAMMEGYAKSFAPNFDDLHGVETSQTIQLPFASQRQRAGKPSRRFDEKDREIPAGSPSSAQSFGRRLNAFVVATLIADSC